MDANLNSEISPFIKVKMIDNQEKIIGKINDKVQVVISLPNMDEFTVDLMVSMTIFSDDAECFIITASKEDVIEKTLKKFDLQKSSISTDYEDFARAFNIKEDNKLKKSLMIIDKNSNIAYQDIL